MIPVLHGVWASGGLAGDFEHIETVTVGSGGAASVTFSSIPGTYKHLQVRGIGRLVGTDSPRSVNLRINSDTTFTNYRSHYIEGSGSTAYSGTLQASGYAASIGSAPKTSNDNYAGFVIDLLDYASTSKNKVLRTLNGEDLNGSGYIGLYSAVWLSTSAVTSITVADFATPTNWSQHTTFSLYGVK